MTLSELRSIRNLIDNLTEDDFNTVNKKVYNTDDSPYSAINEFNYLKISWNEFCDNRIEYILRVSDELGEALLRKAIERRVKISARLGRTA